MLARLPLSKNSSVQKKYICVINSLCKAPSIWKPRLVSISACILTHPEPIIIQSERWWWVGAERRTKRNLDFSGYGNEREEEFKHNSQDRACQCENISWTSEGWNLFTQCLGLSWLSKIYICLHICNSNLKSRNTRTLSAFSTKESSQHQILFKHLNKTNDLCILMVAKFRIY